VWNVKSERRGCERVGGAREVERVLMFRVPNKVRVDVRDIDIN
jgi:hypothetical protein